MGIHKTDGSYCRNSYSLGRSERGLQERVVSVSERGLPKMGLGIGCGREGT